MNAETDVLVVKVNMWMRHKEQEELYRYLRESVSTGVVVIPPYCDVILAPKDVEIVVEQKKEKENGNEKN